jgi:hypothetical protein
MEAPKHADPQEKLIHQEKQPRSGLGDRRQNSQTCWLVIVIVRSTYS